MDYSVLISYHIIRLLQRFQNMKKELELKQNQELAKLRVMTAKTKGTSTNFNASKNNASFLGNMSMMERGSCMIEYFIFLITVFKYSN